jgi:hypothetical protein
LHSLFYKIRDKGKIDLLGIEGVEGTGRWRSGWQGSRWGEAGEMTQEFYAHMNNKIIKNYIKLN